jgi:hypothetical protein
MRRHSAERVEIGLSEAIDRAQSLMRELGRVRSWPQIRALLLPFARPARVAHEPGAPSPLPELLQHSRHEVQKFPHAVALHELRRQFARIVEALQP